MQDPSGQGSLNRIGKHTVIRANPGRACSRLSAVLDPEEVLFRQQFV
jgi:hypothetical protein